MSSEPETNGESLVEKAFEDILEKEEDIRKKELEILEDQAAIIKDKERILEEELERDKHEFRIQIDRHEYVVRESKMTGAQLRLVPPAHIGPEFDLFEVVPGGSDRKIADEETVAIHNGLRFFTAPGKINPGRNC